MPSTLFASTTAHVAEVVLRSPGKGNAMGPDFWREVPGVMQALHDDEAVRCILVRGQGGHFSYGLDLMGMAPELQAYLAATPTHAERKKLLKLIELMQSSFDQMANGAKPVIAAVTGWCIGGGMDLIAACDVRLATKDAKFSVREVKMAIVADMGSLARLPAIIGQGATRELALTGDDVDAARAKELRLVSKVLATPAELFTEAHAMAARIAANPPRVVEGIKQVLNVVSERDARASLEYVAVWNSAFMPSNDLMEAMGSFLERRPPTFTGT